MFLKIFTTSSFIIFATSIITPLDAYSKFSLKKITTMFETEPNEEIIQKKYTLSADGTLIIENLYGNIEITTEWNKNSIILKAIKQNNCQKTASNIILTEKKIGHNNLKIQSTSEDNKCKNRIDYQLIVPAHIKLVLTTQKGTIHVKNVKGPITATTTDGTININGTTNKVNVRTYKNGAINIKQAAGPIHATTHNGNIAITDAINSIVAHADKGRINVTCADIPSASTIQLSTTTGEIQLVMPTCVSAHIFGRTEHGTVTSDHFITLKPQTTMLNNLTWSKFKREVDGILGNGESDIRLESVHSNIKIIQPVIISS